MAYASRKLTVMLQKYNKLNQRCYMLICSHAKKTYITNKLLMKRRVNSYKYSKNSGIFSRTLKNPASAILDNFKSRVGAFVLVQSHNTMCVCNARDVRLKGFDKSIVFDCSVLVFSESAHLADCAFSCSGAVFPNCSEISALWCRLFGFRSRKTVNMRRKQAVRHELYPLDQQS